MRKCNCKDWKKNSNILDLSIQMLHAHGIYTNGLKKVFSYCPWCGNKLKEIKND